MTTTAQPSAKRTTLKSVALPNEHGGWGFLLEPLLLGLLLAPSWAGILIGLATTCVFLLRHPLRISITDWRRGRRFARTQAAERVAALYTAGAGIGFAGAVLLAGAHIMQPLIIAIPFAAVMIGFDLRGESRQWLPELAGPVALSSSAAMITLASGWHLLPSLGLILLLSARAIPSVMYVRARLRLTKHQPVNTRYALAAHVGSVILGMGFALAGAWPALTAASYSVLLVRALLGLRPERQTVPAKVIGFQELAFGLLVVASTTIGFYLGL